MDLSIGLLAVLAILLLFQFFLFRAMKNAGKYQQDKH